MQAVQPAVYDAYYKRVARTLGLFTLMMAPVWWAFAMLMPIQEFGSHWPESLMLVALKVLVIVGWGYQLMKSAPDGPEGIGWGDEDSESQDQETAPAEPVEDMPAWKLRDLAYARKWSDDPALWKPQTVWSWW